MKRSLGVILALLGGLMITVSVVQPTVKPETQNSTQSRSDRFSEKVGGWAIALLMVAGGLKLAQPKKPPAGGNGEA